SPATCSSARSGAGTPGWPSSSRPSPGASAKTGRRIVLVDPGGRACHLRQVRARPVLVHLALCLGLAIPLAACQSVPPAQDGSNSSSADAASVSADAQTPAE